MKTFIILMSFLLTTCMYTQVGHAVYVKQLKSLVAEQYANRGH